MEDFAFKSVFEETLGGATPPGYIALSCILLKKKIP